MSRLMHIIKHRITLLLLAIAVLIGALQLAAPTLVRVLALSWLHDHGAIHARIDRIRINPWLGRLSVQGLSTGDGQAIGQAAIDIDWWPLWHHRIDLRSLHIGHARLHLMQRADGSWTPAGIRLPPATPSAQAWPVLLHGVHLHDVHIMLTGHGLKADMPIQRLTLALASMSPTGAQILNAELKLGAGSMAAGDYHADDASMLLRGQLMLPADATAPGARHLAIRVQGLQLRAGQTSLRIDHALVHGIVAQGAGDVQAAGIELHGVQAGAGGGLTLGAARSATLTDLSLRTGTHLAFSRLSLQDITLPATADHALGRIAAITATGADIDGGLHLDRLAVQGLDVALLHRKDGLAVIDRLRAMASAAGPSAKTAPALSIGAVSIDDTSRISLRDAAIAPPFATRLKIVSFKLDHFDTQGTTPARLDAAWHLGDEASLSLKGDFRLHGGLKSADMSFVIQRLSMPPLSGYAERDFGNAIQTGQLDLNSRVHIHGDAIRADNRLVVRNLELKAMPQAGKATQTLGMPLGMAVDMLRDDRGDIDLKVPVSGRLGDPNVHLSDAFDQALASAMRSAALSSASLLLQPYGSILPALSMAAGLIGQISKPRLTPIAFAPRSAALSEQARAYVARIATLMKKKSFRLQVCGVATSGDFLAGPAPAPGSSAYNNLLTLASSRSSQIVKALVAAGIDPARLFSCRPRIDASGKAGHVELLLD